jgi:enterochelin esterase-like enzyme
VVLATTLCIANVGVGQQPCKSTVVGDLRIEQFQSKIFDRMITVRVWLPSGYTDVSQTSKKYPTLYLLDGQNAFAQCTAFKGERALQLDETITRLIAEHKIAPMIVVGVDSAHGEGRDYEYERFAMSEHFIYADANRHEVRYRVSAEMHRAAQKCLRTGDLRLHTEMEPIRMSPDIRLWRQVR